MLVHYAVMWDPEELIWVAWREREELGRFHEFEEAAATAEMAADFEHRKTGVTTAVAQAERRAGQDSPWWHTSERQRYGTAED